MKLNKKGFTLIELIAVIVIIALLFMFVVPNFSKYLEASRQKSEEIFYGEIENIINNYVSLYKSELELDTSVVKKISKEDSLLGTSYDVKVYRYKYLSIGNIYSSNISFSNIIDKGILNEGEFVNPNGNIKYDKDSSTFTVYRDSDYVYCFSYTLKENSEDTGFTKSTCSYDNYDDLPNYN